MAKLIEEMFRLHAKKNGLDVGERMAGLVPETNADKTAKNPDDKASTGGVVQLGLLD